MAVTLEELQLKFKSEIAAATSKDEAALARVDAAVRQSQGSLAKLQQAHAANAKAAEVAAREQKIAESQLANSRPEEQAARMAAAKRAQAVAAKAAAKEETGAAALSKAHQQHAALVKAKPELVAMAKASAEAKEQAKASAGAFANMGKGVSSAGGPLGALLAQVESFKEIGFAGAVGIAAAAAVALTAAVLVGAGALASYGLAAAGAARDARILAEALTGSKELGTEFTAVVSQLASKVPLAKGQIADLARELNLMKLGRRDMQAGLTAIAITTSAIGESAGNVIKGVVQSSSAMKRFSLGARDMWGEYTGLAGSGLKKADVLAALAKQLGVSAREAERQLMLGRVKLKDGLRALEAATQARFGKTISAQMLSVNTQFEKAKEGLSGMLAGVNLEPALSGLKSLLSIFDENTVAGATLKTILQVGFGGLSDALGVLLPLGKDFFLEMMIGALEMYLAIRPIARQIRDWVEPFLTAENAAMAGKIAIYGLVAVLGLVAVAAASAAAALALPFVVVGATIWGIVESIDMVWKWLVSSAKAIGGNIVDALAGAISGDADKVLSAVKNLGDSIVTSFKGLLGIASPSKVFAAFGRFTVQGFVEGVDKEADAAQGAVDDMAPAAPGGGAGGASGLRLGGGTTVYLTTGDIYFAGKKATEDERRSLVDVLTDELQSAINAVGAGQPLGAT